MITYKLNKLGLAYNKKEEFNKGWTVFSIEIPNGKSEFKLNIQSTQDFYIDWGDDALEQQIDTRYVKQQILDSDKFYTNDKKSVSHEYAIPGRYLVKLKNVTYFYTHQDTPYIIGVYQLGNILTSCKDMFKGNLSLDYLHQNLRIPEQVKDCSYMFYDCQSILTLPEYLLYTDINNTQISYNQVNRPLELTQIKNYSFMFANCIRLMYLAEHFVVANTATNMDSMFENCQTLRYIGDYFYIPNSCNIHLNNIFKNCISLQKIPYTLTLINIHECASGTFENCKVLEEIPITFSLNDQIKNIDHIFKSCVTLSSISENLNFGEQLSSAVESFYECKSIKQLPEIFQIPSTVVNLSGTFAHCISLNELPSSLTLIDTQNAILDCTFKNCNSLVLSEAFEMPSAAISCIETFASCTNFTSMPNSFKIPNESCLTYQSMFESCMRLTEFLNDAGQELYPSAVNISKMFKGCINLISIPDTFIFPETLKNCSEAFYDCQNLEWDWEISNPWPWWQQQQTTTNSSTIIDIFGGFTSYDFITGTTDINFAGMFYNCKNILGYAPGEILWKLSIEPYAEQLVITTNTGQLTAVVPEYQGSNCFYGCIELQNYGVIPKYWGGLGQAEFGPYWATFKCQIDNPNTTINIHQIITKQTSDPTLKLNKFYINWDNPISLTGQIPEADTTNNESLNEIKFECAEQQYSEQLSAYIMNNITHTYKQAGIYYITLQQIGSFQLGNNNWLIDILWLGNNLNTCEAAVSGSTNLCNLSYDLLLPKRSKNLNSMFRDCINLTTLPEQFNLRKETQLVSSMFERMYKSNYIT